MLTKLVDSNSPHKCVFLWCKILSPLESKIATELYSSFEMGSRSANPTQQGIPCFRINSGKMLESFSAKSGAELNPPTNSSESG